MVNAITLRRIKRYMLGAGVGLLGIAFLMFAAFLLGAFDGPKEFIAGESTIHSIARVAIIGCLLAAVGSQE